jgi:hypothetical protein
MDEKMGSDIWGEGILIELHIGIFENIVYAKSKRTHRKS